MPSPDDVQVGRDRKLDLVVVGAGPTGLAALFQAARLGMRGVAIEAGPQPASSVQAQMEGQVYVSPAHHYEISRLPLDCRSAYHCTREDLLYYYARVINYGQLSIQCNTRCTGVAPLGSGVRVRVRTADGPSEMFARNVVLTSWFRPRPIPEALRPSPDSSVRVHRTLKNAAQLAGRRVVVMGGGLSAIETATTLMLCGQSITLLARSGVRSVARPPHLDRLVSSTGSSVIERVQDIALERSGISFADHGRRVLLRCTDVILRIGCELDDSALELCRRAEILSAAEISSLRAADALTTRLKREPDPSQELLEQRAALARPDFTRQLLRGVRGIHIAGGILHEGAWSTGVAMSILSAEMAVRAASGEVIDVGPSLPAYLKRSTLDRVVLPDFDLVAPLRLRAITSWTRHWYRTVLDARLLEGGKPPETSPGGFLLLPPRSKWRRLCREILDLCDGETTVLELANANGLSSRRERTQFLATLQLLWFHNALTWLPPPGGLSERGTQERQRDLLALRCRPTA